MAPPKTAPPQKSQKQMIEEVQADQKRQDKRHRAMLHLGKFESNMMAGRGGLEDRGQEHRLCLRDSRQVAQGGCRETREERRIVESNDVCRFVSCDSRGACVCKIALQKETSWLAKRLNKRQSGSWRPDPTTKKLSVEGPHTPATAIINGVEDYAQAGLQGVLGILPTVVTRELEPVSEDPLVYQNDLENRISKVKKDAFLAFGKIKGDWANASLTFWDSYREEDATKAHQHWEKSAEELPKPEHLPSVDVMSRDLERGIWVSYVLNNDRDHFPGKIIWKRLNDVGILIRAGVADHSTEYTVGTSDTRYLMARRVYDWAKTYQVSDLLEYKKGGDYAKEKMRFGR